MRHLLWRIRTGSSVENQSLRVLSHEHFHFLKFRELTAYNLLPGKQAGSDQPIRRAASMAA